MRRRREAPRAPRRSRGAMRGPPARGRWRAARRARAASRRRRPLLAAGPASSSSSASSRPSPRRSASAKTSAVLRPPPPGSRTTAWGAGVGRRSTTSPAPRTRAGARHELRRAHRPRGRAAMASRPATSLRPPGAGPRRRRRCRRPGPPRPGCASRSRSAAADVPSRFRARRPERARRGSPPSTPGQMTSSRSAAGDLDQVGERERLEQRAERVKAVRAPRSQEEAEVELGRGGIAMKSISHLRRASRPGRRTPRAREPRPWRLPVGRARPGAARTFASEPGPDQLDRASQRLATVGEGGPHERPRGGIGAPARSAAGRGSPSRPAAAAGRRPGRPCAACAPRRRAEPARSGRRRRGSRPTPAAGRRSHAGPSPSSARTVGSSSMVRRISGVAIEYGRLATTAVGAGSRAPRSSFIASPQCRSTLRPRRHTREHRLQAAVDLDRMDMRRRPCQPLRQHPFSRADLEHDVVGTELGVADDRVEQVLVGEEVLAEPDHGSGPHQPKRSRAFASTVRSSCS